MFLRRLILLFLCLSALPVYQNAEAVIIIRRGGCTDTDYNMDTTSTLAEAIGAEKCFVSKVTASANPITSVTLSVDHCSGSTDGQCNFIVYDDNSGVPGTVVGQTGAVSVGFLGTRSEVTLDITGTPAASTIHVGMCVEDEGRYYKVASAALSSRSKAQSNWDSQTSWDTAGDTINITKQMRGKITICE